MVILCKCVQQLPINQISSLVAKWPYLALLKAIGQEEHGKGLVYNGSYQ